MSAEPAFDILRAVSVPADVSARDKLRFLRFVSRNLSLNFKSTDTGLVTFQPDGRHTRIIDHDGKSVHRLLIDTDTACVAVYGHKIKCGLCSLCDASDALRYRLGVSFDHEGTITLSTDTARNSYNRGKEQLRLLQRKIEPLIPENFKNRNTFPASWKVVTVFTLLARVFADSIHELGFVQPKQEARRGS